MIRNDFVILAVALGCHSDVRSLLPSRFIPQNSLRFDQSRSIDVPRQIHAASISSRTKCRRMIFGNSIVSSK
jgi:hypothetical protein